MSDDDKNEYVLMGCIILDIVVFLVWAYFTLFMVFHAPL